MQKINLNITFQEALSYFDGNTRLMRDVLGPVTKQAIHTWRSTNSLPPKRVLLLQQYLFENERDQMQFYNHHIGDFIKSTHFLSHEDRSIYLGLLWYFYDTEQPLTKNLDDLAMRVKATKDQVMRIINVFFIETDEGYVNPRAVAELEKTYEKSEKARQNVMKRWEKEKKYDRNTNELLPNTQDPRPNINSMQEIEQTFDEFWETWPSSKRKVDRAKCLSMWKTRKLYTLTRLIVDHVQAMKEDKEWLDGFVPMPSTYLNQRRWEAGTGDTKVVALDPLLKKDTSYE